MPKIKNLTGETFGKLTVLEQATEREGRYIVWKCRCVCGSTVLASSKKLQRGTIISCGCDGAEARKRGAPYEDITDQRFGDLVAVRRAESVKGKTMWLCRCDCGNEKVVEKQALKTGKVTNCGCKKKERVSPMFKDLTGQKFGRLTAIVPTKRRDGKGSVFWKCRCDCGGEAEVTEDSLRTGNTVSCGCRKQEIHSNIRNTLTFVDGTCIDYLRSRKSRSDNKSGFRGVYRIGDRYRVNIGFQSKRYYLGTYDNYEEAVSVRQDAEKELHERYIKLYDWWSERARSDPDWAEDNPFTFQVEVKDKEIYTISPLFQAANM
jgi:hypothetical protein